MSDGDDHRVIGRHRGAQDAINDWHSTITIASESEATK